MEWLSLRFSHGILQRSSIGLRRGAMRNKLAPSNAIRPSLGQFGVHRPDTAKGEQYAIMVVNGSDVPIYDIRVESQKADKSCDNPVL